MDITLKTTDQAVTLSLSGRLDTVTAPALDSAIRELDGSTDLTLDMAGVSYISSAGLRVLLSAQKKLQKTGSLKLTNVCADVMEVFEMTGFAEILVIV